MKKRKICVITGYRSEYLKMESVLLSLKEKKNIDLEIISIGAHNLSGYGNTYDIILKSGLKISHYLYTTVDGTTPESMSQSVGLGVIQITAVLKSINPDMVLIAADRYEILSAAIAASLCNIPLCHLQGGEVSGTIDETIRHTITKLSHIHFPATELSKLRILKMGENPKLVFNEGCPAIDYIKNYDLKKDREYFLKHSFPSLNNGKRYGIIIQHPVTMEYKQAYEQMTETLMALQKFGLQCVLIYPNPDAGSNDILRAIRAHNRKYSKDSIIIEEYKTMDMGLYLNLLYHSSCLIGNSSSGIREAHVYGVPVINIGSRQKGRERTKNIIDISSYSCHHIYDALKSYVDKKIYDTNVYGDGTAGKKIANILETIDLTDIIDKRFIDFK